jgi:site-specific DNA-adenine methylase
MTYPGGKSGSGVYQKIINQIPPHETYIEPFLGHGSILLHKKPAACSIAMDIDARATKRIRSVIAEKSDFGDRGRSVIVKNCDAISWLKENLYRMGKKTFIYLDPPYLFSVRSSKQRIYAHEFGTEEQHKELLDVIVDAPCMVAISGYWSSLYNSILAHWRAISFNTTNRAGDVVTEWLWMNYPEPKALHDYRYLGDNFRQRERLKRIRTNWTNRLANMDQLERYMLTAAIAEYSETAASS